MHKHTNPGATFIKYNAKRFNINSLKSFVRTLNLKSTRDT